MSLDPADWTAFRALAHRALDDAFDAIEHVAEGPAWRPIPDAVKDAIAAPLPRAGAPLDELYAEFERTIAPYPTGNLHPRFAGWVHGAGTPAGALASLLEGAMNANAGGREHAAIYVERTVVGWFRDLFGFPPAASGILTSGTSMSTLLAFVVAREAASLARGDVSGDLTGLTAYAATTAHEAIRKALRIAGLPADALRLVRADAQHRIDVDALREAIAGDRSAGLRPFLVVGTAGTVDVGATDDLGALGDLAAAEGAWFHVDGAFGALAILSPAHAARLAGLERADSLAFDLHKWLHVPYAVGAVLIRDGARHRAAFGTGAAYLRHAERGTAAGDPWPAELGLELSRPFRALPAWLTLRHYGLDRLGASIAENCRLAERLAARVSAEPELELLGPVPLNIVCFRYRPPGRDEVDLDALNDRIVVELQESGLAVPSTTRIDGTLAIRCCLINHRTTERDVDLIADAVLATGRSLPR